MNKPNCFFKPYNKHGNKKTTLDGIVFDSAMEATRYAELKLLERAGEITSLKLQPVFVLLENYKREGVTIRGIKYYADFSYMEKGKCVVEDVKGMETDVFKLKRKLFEYHNPGIKLTLIK